MIQQLLALLPRQINTLVLVLAIAGALLGGLLWLAGARFNRTLVTLLSVTAGGLFGLQFPHWFGWRLEGWATAVLAALVLGISGYVLHKLWVGVGLGVVLAAWAALVTIALYPEPKGFAWPTIEGIAWRDVLLTLWNAFSPEARRILPYACGGALLTGVAITFLWPRLGVVLLYSTAGVSLFLGLGTLALNAAKRDWLGIIPNQTSSQLIVLGSLVAFGAILQWRCIPSTARARHAHPPVRR
jgi:hypothetical protein